MESYINLITNNIHDQLFKFLQLQGINAYLVMSIIGIHLMVRATRFSPIIYSTLMLPSTFLHESAHYITSKLLNGKPVSFSIIPRIEGKYLTMGEVGSINIRWYNAFPIAMAPLLLFPAILLLDLEQIGKIEGYVEWFKVYLAATLLTGAIPSNVDFRIAQQYIIGFYLYLLSIGLLIYYFFQDNVYFKLALSYITRWFEYYSKIFFGT